MRDVFFKFSENIYSEFLGVPHDFSNQESTLAYLKKKFPEAKKIIIPLQEHTNKVLDDTYNKELGGCDGIFTQKTNVICTVKTADCIGALFYNPQEKIIACIHAGWKGLAQKIFSKFLEKYSKEIREGFYVKFSPCLQRCCAQFSDPYNETPNFFHEYIEQRQEKFFVDLPAIAKKELQAQGIKKENIQLSTICTKCSKQENFWSHRNGDKQRNLSYIFLK